MYKIKDIVLFSNHCDGVSNGEIVDIKPRFLGGKKYKILYNFAFDRVCKWFPDYDLIKKDD